MSRSYKRTHLTDGQAKDALRKWPLRPREEWGWAVGVRCGPWVRVLPGAQDASNKKAAKLAVVGMEWASTYPDGMWISLGPNAEFADIVAVEHCGARQNFYDKRSRYMPTLHARELRCPDGWLDATATIEHGVQRTMRELCVKFPGAATGEQRIPLRHVRVLYALHPDDYDVFHLTPFGAHEFCCPHSSLAMHTSPKLREFVRRLSTDVHWYTK